MSDNHNDINPEWLEHFEELANQELADGSACDQVHPIVAAWYAEVMAGDPPESRDSVWQAIHCLTTEVINDIPPSVLDALEGHEDAEEDLGDWVTELLLVGRAFQIALDSGRLDDL